MKVTFYGHACFLIEVENTLILIDPFLSGNDACPIDPNDVNCDMILLSHGHQDHVLDAESIAKRLNCEVICNYEVGNWYIGKGLEHVTQVNQGGSVKTAFGSIKYVSAVHSSSLPDGSYGGNPGGFVIKGAGQELYYAGDTALHMDMELIGRHHTIDIAILPIGDTFTMGYEDAAIASQMVNCKNCIGMHFDTWPPLAIDHDAAKTAFRNRGAQLTLMKIGETIEH